MDAEAVTARGERKDGGAKEPAQEAAYQKAKRAMDLEKSRTHTASHRQARCPPASPVRHRSAAAGTRGRRW